MVKQDWEKQKDKVDDEMEQAKKAFDKQVKTHKQPGRKGLPTFFGL